MPRQIGRLWHFVSDSIPRILMSLCMAAMMIHISLDAMARYFFNSPLPATIEIASLYYLVPIAFLPLGALQDRDEHIRAELINETNAPRMALWADRIGLLLCAVTGGFATVWTTIEAYQRTLSGEVWESAYALIPAWPMRWVVPIGFGLFMAASLARFSRSFRNVG